MKTAIFTDKTNGIEAEIRYNPWNDNSYSGMVKGALKWGFGKKKKQPEEEKEKRGDDCHIKIYQPASSGKKKERVDLVQGEGNWMSYL